MWDFEKDKLGSPVCARTIRVNTGKEVPSISCLSAHENMNMIAVGTHQGVVNLIRGNLTKDRSSKQRGIDTGSSPVTGLGFKQVGQSILLYVSTSEQILSYVLTAKDNQSVLDTPGCKFNCSTMSDHTQDFRYASLLLPRHTHGDMFSLAMLLLLLGSWWGGARLCTSTRPVRRDSA